MAFKRSGVRLPLAPPILLTKAADFRGFCFSEADFSHGLSDHPRSVGGDPRDFGNVVGDDPFGLEYGHPARASSGPVASGRERIGGKFDEGRRRASPTHPPRTNRSGARLRRDRRPIGEIKHPSTRVPPFPTPARGSEGTTSEGVHHRITSSVDGNYAPRHRPGAVSVSDGRSPKRRR